MSQLAVLVAVRSFLPSLEPLTLVQHRINAQYQRDGVVTAQLDGALRARIDQLEVVYAQYNAQDGPYEVDIGGNVARFTSASAFAMRVMHMRRERDGLAPTKRALNGRDYVRLVGLNPDGSCVLVTPPTGKVRRGSSTPSRRAPPPSARSRPSPPPPPWPLGRGALPLRIAADDLRDDAAGDDRADPGDDCDDGDGSHGSGSGGAVGADDVIVAAGGGSARASAGRDRDGDGRADAVLDANPVLIVAAENANAVAVKVDDVHAAAVVPAAADGVAGGVSVSDNLELELQEIRELESQLERRRRQVLHRLEQRVAFTAAELEQRQRRYDEVTATLDALRAEVEQESLQCDADLELLDEADPRGAVE
jgi:hypothetical protein